MKVIMFNPQFHGPVRRGEKCQTIRPPRKRPIRPGDQLSLRAWIGQPYRSKQRELRAAVCLCVDRATIAVDFADDAEAQRDGFPGAPEMRRWFEDHHDLPFTGERITWRLLP